MDWLKDKKNLPIVIVLAVVLLLGSGGLIAWELGAFSGSPDTTASSAPTATGQPPSLPTGVGGPGGQPPGALPPGALPPVASTGGAVKTASVAGKPISTDPRKGNDPFYLSGGQKKVEIFAMRLPPRDFLPPMNLFSLRPPTPPAAPISPSQAYNQASNYRLAGIVNGSDGNINAILDLGGSTQTVKPGDSLPDGSRITTIQSTSVTLRTANGLTISLPLSAGAPDQSQQPNQFNGPPGYNGPPPGFAPGGPPPGFAPGGPPPGFTPGGPPAGFVPGGPPPGFQNGGG